MFKVKKFYFFFIKIYTNIINYTNRYNLIQKKCLTYLL